MMQSDSSSPLILRPIAWDAVEAITQSERLDDWAADFPDDGDVVIAGVLQRGGPDRLAPVWGHHQIVERSSGLVVGDVGFFGPPEEGRAQIGYGVVPSRRGRGYATDAVRLLTSLGWMHGALEIVAKTDLENRASQRVLEKAAFELLDEGEQRTYRLKRPH
jgi:RimJ/RimL family protein N-acetyltransferase